MSHKKLNVPGGLLKPILYGQVKPFVVAIGLFTVVRVPAKTVGAAFRGAVRHLIRNGVLRHQPLSNGNGGWYDTVVCIEGVE